MSAIAVSPAGPPEMSEECAEIISHSSTSSAELVAFPSDSDKIESCSHFNSEGIDFSEVNYSDKLGSSVPSSLRGKDSPEANHPPLLSTSNLTGKMMSQTV